MNAAIHYTTIPTSDVDGLTPAGVQLRMTEDEPDRGSFHQRDKRITQLAGGLGQPHHSILSRIDYASEIVAEAEAARAELVTAARAAGTSWASIGQALGMTKQGASQRYGRS